jgi:hypothetical protein
MHLFQSEIYESDDSDMPIVSVLPDLPILHLHKHINLKYRIQSSQTLVTIDTNQ